MPNAHRPSPDPPPAASRNAPSDAAPQPQPLPSPALTCLVEHLREQNYRFVTVTPATHRRILLRGGNPHAASARDIWGWNLPFAESVLPRDLHGALADSGLITQEAAGWRSRIRFSTIGAHLFLHSGYPTQTSDAVFFGPDTYRFVRLVRDEVERQGARAQRILDVGCGSGAGGLMAAAWLERSGAPAARLELADINPQALAMAGFNAGLRGLSGLTGVELREADLYAGTAHGVDLIVANPPYLVDADQRIYRHGGGSLGFDLSLKIVAEGIPLLSPGGRLVLYTGVPILRGKDPFREAIEPWTAQAGLATRYWEIDPDVFGEELEQCAYREADRIAAVALVVHKTGGAGR